MPVPGGVAPDAGFVLGQAMTVTLLGTGHPEPSQERFGPAALVEASGQQLLVDAGRGVAQRIWELDIPVGEIRHVFLTHLHSDHTSPEDAAAVFARVKPRLTVFTHISS